MARKLMFAAAALSEWPLAYRLEAPAPCPDCGNANWLVGRVSAECACCGTALPLSNADVRVRAMARPLPMPANLAA